MHGFVLHEVARKHSDTLELGSISVGAVELPWVPFLC